MSAALQDLILGPQCLDISEKRIFLCLSGIEVRSLTLTDCSPVIIHSLFSRIRMDILTMLCIIYYYYYYYLTSCITNIEQSYDIVRVIDTLYPF